MFKYVEDLLTNQYWGAYIRIYSIYIYIVVNMLFCHLVE